MPPTSPPAAQTPFATLARGVHAEPSERRRDPGDDLHGDGAVHALDVRAGALCGRDQLADRSLAHACLQRRAREPERRPRPWLAGDPLDDVDLRPRARLVALARSCSRRRRAWRRAARARRNRRARRGPAARASRDRRTRRARRSSRRPPRRPSRSPSPVLPGAARSTRCSASGVTCSRTSSRSAWKPPVARTSGVPVGSSRSGSSSRSSPARSASAEVSDAVSNRTPTVRGFPVSRATTRAPRLSSQARSSSRRSWTRRLEHGVAAGALAPEVVELAVPPDDTARETHRAARPLELLEHEDARAASGRLCRRDEAGHSGACDDEVGHARLRRARSPACARRTRA